MLQLVLASVSASVCAGTDFGDEILDQGGIMQYESASQFGTPHKSMMMESIPESPTADEQPPISSEGAAAARARWGSCWQIMAIA